MTKTEIAEIIVGMLRELQIASGDMGCEITPMVVPLSALGFFDSLLAIETTLVLEERLGYPCGEISIFTDQETSQPLTITAIASRLAQKVVA